MTACTGSVRSCRCDHHRSHRTRYQKQRRLSILRGQPLTVDGTGTRRRLQALHRIGWTSEDIASRLGMTRMAINNLMRRDTPVFATTKAKVTKVYDELWDVTPPPMHGKAAGVRNRSINRAKRLGWAPPLAWDDDTIDDPDARPDLGEPDTRKAWQKVDLDDVEFLLSTANYTRAGLAARLHVKPGSIYTACLRDDRLDLWDRLIRNETGELRQEAS